MKPSNASNRCAYPWQQMIIDLTGEVVPCCFWSGYGNSGKPLGNTNVDSIDEIWHGEKYRALRAKMASGDLRDHPCGNCMAYRWANGTFPKFSWPAGFVHEQGYCYLGQIPEQFLSAVGDSAAAIRLFENDTELAYPNAGHDDVRQLGNGRYSVWHGWLYFSSSDELNPLNSGRRYRLVCGEREVELGGLVRDSASGRNLLRAYQEFQDGRAEVECEPSMISLVSTADCNIDCPGCSQNIVRLAKVQHRPQTVPDILSKVPFLSQFIWHGGEPYLIKSFREFINNFKPEHNPNLTFGFTSNGTMINDAEVEKLKIFPRINASVSIDSFDKNTFGKIRFGADFDRVWHNVKRLMQAHNAPTHIFSVGMIICKSNFRELADNLQFAIDNDLGLNLSPVVIYPVVEQLNCFSDFATETAGWKESLDRADDIVALAKADTRVAIQRVNPSGMVRELRQIFDQAQQDYSEVASLVCRVDDPHDAIANMKRPAIVAYLHDLPVAYAQLKPADQSYLLRLPQRHLSEVTQVRVDLLHDVMEPNGYLTYIWSDIDPSGQEAFISVPQFSGAARPRNINWANYGVSTPDGHHIKYPEQVMEVYHDLYRHELSLKVPDR